LRGWPIHGFVVREDLMKLRAPKNVTFWVAVVLAVAGLLGNLGVVGALAGYAFWLVFVGFVLLMLGVLLKDL